MHEGVAVKDAGLLVGEVTHKTHRYDSVREEDDTRKGASVL